MRAVKNNLPAPLGKLETQKALARANGTSRRASEWAGENVARSWDHPTHHPILKRQLATALLRGPFEHPWGWWSRMALYE
jgi:hypothetical protein